MTTKTTGYPEVWGFITVLANPKGRVDCRCTGCGRLAEPMYVPEMDWPFPIRRFCHGCANEMLEKGAITIPTAK